MKIRLLIIFLILFRPAFSQPGYNSTMRKVQADYVLHHEVVQGKDRKYFRFYPVDEGYRISADFIKLKDSSGFMMKTSGKKTSRYFKYGTISFKLRDTLVNLTIYQSQELLTNPQYKDYLFIPFTDLTSGEGSYGGGRYLDLTTSDIRGNKAEIDFNRAYNPYCAYATGYNCPVPPRENDLSVG